MFISVKVAGLEALWLPWRQTSQQQFKHVQEKTQTKITIPKINSNLFRVVQNSLVPRRAWDKFLHPWESQRG